MHITELTELQFKNYSNMHSKKNYKQSIEYAKLKKDNDYQRLYLGLIDDKKNVHAATLILEKKINNKHKYGYVPNGYLINFHNLDLLATFTKELKDYLKKLNYIYLRINPLINYQIYNSDFILKENNSEIINSIKLMGYDLIPDTSKYKMLLEANNINTTYKNFKRSLRRNINECLKKGIVVYQGDDDDKLTFLNMLDNKSHYENMMEIFNTPNNKFEFYLAKLEPETYINNYRYLLKKEQIRNELLNDKLKDPKIKKTNNLFTKKMDSDKILTKYKNEIMNGTHILQKYPKGIIIAAVAIITNKREITFIKECYTDEFKHIRSVPLIKWEIIKKYISTGYKKFDLGNVTISKNQITKTGYNGDIIEYSNSFDLVINDMLYKLNGITKRIKNEKENNPENI